MNNINITLITDRIYDKLTYYWSSSKIRKISYLCGCSLPNDKLYPVDSNLKEVELIY